MTRQLWSTLVSAATFKIAQEAFGLAGGRNWDRTSDPSLVRSATTTPPPALTLVSGPLTLVIREEPDVRRVLEMLIRYEHTYNQAISIRLSEAEGLATIRMDLELGEPTGSRCIAKITEAMLSEPAHVAEQYRSSPSASPA